MILYKTSYKNVLSMIMVNSSPTIVKNSDANNVNSSSYLAVKLFVNLSLLFSQLN